MLKTFPLNCARRALQMRPLARWFFGVHNEGGHFCFWHVVIIIVRLMTARARWRRRRKQQQWDTPKADENQQHSLVHLKLAWNLFFSWPRLASIARSIRDCNQFVVVVGQWSAAQMILIVPRTNPKPTIETTSNCRRREFSFCCCCCCCSLFK